MRSRRRIRVLALVTTILAPAYLLVALPQLQAASADTAPVGNVPATVSADGLPTVQIDGVVWAQVVVGNTVYATGSFRHARPAGTVPGDPSQVVRSNLLAYDVRTGKLITTFNHSLNAQGRSIAASPDGSRVYVGGDFTTVDGATRTYVAAFDTATGALDTTFKPSLGSSVTALTVTPSTVYAGGNFLRANGVVLSRLAAFTTGGALLSWRPSADDQVSALLVAPGGATVIAAGKFITLNGKTVNGIGAVNALTGASTTWNAGFPLHDAGTDAGFTSLSTDGTHLFGSGFNFHGNGGTGNFEGRFASDFVGNIVWIDSCHGDTYGTFVQSDVLYEVGHAHDCSDIGAFDDGNPRTWHRSTAETVTPSGRPLFHNTNAGYADFGGQPGNSLLHWFPSLSAGTYTGQSQGPWSVAGNDDYVVLGGEFPKVNNKPQQGLVRFAVRSVAPNKWPPYVSTTMTPTVTSPAAGTARVRWQTTWDADNENLTYKVFRDGGTTPVYSTTAATNFWTLPWLGFLDNGLASGSKHTYKVQVVDPFNNTITSAVSAAVTVQSTTPTVSAFAHAVHNDGADSFWPLSEPTGSTGYDKAAWDDLSLGTGIAHGVSGPIKGETATAFGGSSTGTATDATFRYAPDTFSVEAWFKTTTTQGGKIIGFGDGQGAPSVTDDRQLYLDNAGHVLFGVRASSAKAVSSSHVYNDGKWHHAAATFSTSTGMNLYLDGVKVAGNQTITTSALRYMGYWHVGGDTVSGWPSRPSSAYLNGSLADVAVYPQVLSASQVLAHFQAAAGSGGGSNVAPTARVTASCSKLTCTLDGSTSSDTDGSIAGYAWTFGDGSTGTGATPSHTYAAAGTYSVTLTVTDNGGATNATTTTVSPTGSTGPVQFASDSFNRTVSSGWGAADLGGGWTASSTASVVPGSGRLTVNTAGSSSQSYLGAVSATDTEVSTTVTLDKAPTGSGSYFYVIVRRVGTNGEYRALLHVQSSGAVSIAYTKLNGSSAETLIKGETAIAGLTLTPGVALHVRVQAVGTNPTTLRARAWTGATEPSAWNATATDTTAALQTAGAIGLRAYLTGSTTNAPVTFAVSSFVGESPTS